MLLLLFSLEESKNNNNNNMMWPLLKFFAEENFRVTEEFFSRHKLPSGLVPPAADRVVTCPWATQCPVPNSSG